jgi:hypothetical protein
VCRDGSCVQRLQLCAETAVVCRDGSCGRLLLILRKTLLVGQFKLESG